MFAKTTWVNSGVKVYRGFSVLVFILELKQFAKSKLFLANKTFFLLLQINFLWLKKSDRKGFVRFSDCVASHGIRITFFVFCFSIIMCSIHSLWVNICSTILLRVSRRNFARKFSIGFVPLLNISTSEEDEDKSGDDVEAGAEKKNAPPFIKWTLQSINFSLSLVKSEVT